MKITVNNLGILRHASFELADITVICGENNTGKTYATHAAYGFFRSIYLGASVNCEGRVIDKLLEKGSVNIPLDTYIKNLQKTLDEYAKGYSQVLHKVFAAAERRFEDASFRLEMESGNQLALSDIDAKAEIPKKEFFRAHLDKDKKILQVSLIAGKGSDEIPERSFLENSLGRIIAQILFGDSIPRPFLASTERTGAAIFQKDIGFAKNHLMEKIADNISLLENFSKALSSSKFPGEYPLAVKDNVEFIWNLSDLTKSESEISRKHPDILKDFRAIIGGTYKVSKEGGVQYVPQAKVPRAREAAKLEMVESSSSVRSLLDFGFYLMHLARPGDLLMIDEPELNLHPKNQRKIARLFARLANVGIKVFVTTHSDYIVKELSTLIMLNSKDKKLEKLAKKQGYIQDELLDFRKIKVYVAGQKSIMLPGGKRKTKCHTMVPADIDEESGIDAWIFDDTIEIMNQIQEKIIFGNPDNE